MPKLVMILSPFGGVSSQLAYAKAALLDSLARGEAPFASHLIYPQVLSDFEESERRLGIESGMAWLAKAEEVIAYQDHGITAGMEQEIEEAKRLGIPVSYRNLEENPYPAIGAAGPCSVCGRYKPFYFAFKKISHDGKYKTNVQRAVIICGGCKVKVKREVTQ